VKEAAKMVRYLVPEALVESLMQGPA